MRGYNFPDEMVIELTGGLKLWWPEKNANNTECYTNHTLVFSYHKVKPLQYDIKCQLTLSSNVNLKF